MAREQFMINVEFIVAEAAKAEFGALGCWLRLTAHCAARLLGGRLKGAQAWTDGTCSRMVGVPRAALDEVVAADLAIWDGPDLLLDGYDLEGERLWRKKSKGGKDGNKLRWSNRTPTPPPRQESDRSSESESDIGVRIGDCDSDSGESPPGLSLASSAGAREGVGCAATDPGQGGEAPPGGPGRGDGEDDSIADPRLVVVKRHDGYLVDPRTGEILSAKWDTVFEVLTPPQIEAVFANAKRLTTHEVRYPSGFARALEALRKERRAEQVRQDQDEAQRAQHQRREDERAQLDVDRRRSAHQVEQLDAWLASPDGAPTKAVIAINPAAKRWLESAHKHPRTGGGGNLALWELAKLHPELDRFRHLEAPAPQGSAP